MSYCPSRSLSCEQFDIRPVQSELVLHYCGTQGRLAAGFSQNGIRNCLRICFLLNPALPREADWLATWLEENCS
jgi:hypothetical protein